VVASRSTQPQGVWTFRSRPDLSPPVVEVIRQAHDAAPGYIFVAPKEGTGQNGAMIVDNSGQVVWFLPVQSEVEYAMDFKVQYYQGEPVLTWEEGEVVAGGYSLGEFVILDGSYQEISRFSAGNGFRADHHDFLITSGGTAMFTIYSPVSMDLFSVGGPRNGMVAEGIVQAVDMGTGEMFFEWHSLDHVDLDESYFEPPKDQREAFDYFHINSVDIDHDSNLLVSARHTSTVYKIDPMSGEVIWRLGGKKSDFDMGPGTRFAYQHDARRLSDGTITIFDNGWKRGEHSRGLVLELDEDEMTVSLARDYPHPYGQHAATQGNMQTLPKGNVFIGWGSEPLFSEFGSDGELLFNARFPPEVESYRAFRFPWKGQPSDDPAVVAERGSDNKVTLYASWNGATEVTTWEVLAGPGPERIKPVGSVPRHGFETAITVGTAERYVGVRAKDSSGRVLGTSRATRPV
jgi:hypothetical protein